jgi:hypothetical protein
MLAIAAIFVFFMIYFNLYLKFIYMYFNVMTQKSISTLIILNYFVNN